ncbi:MAG: penicillin-binding protein 2 [Candidatus Parcubacteria bacterium]|nr:penicillin-binding protein 2 [Candidatus Parcubacteria bacterium]
MFSPRKNLDRIRIKRPGLEIEPEEIFCDALVQKNEQGPFQKKMEVPIKSRSLKILWLVFFILGGIVFIKNFQFQIIQHDEFSVLAQKNKYVVSKLEAQRGVIYDKNFQQLVYNRPSYDLTFDKAKLSEIQDSKQNIFGKIAWILGVKPETIEEKITSADAKDESVLVSQNLDYQKLIMFESNADELEGFSIKNVGMREYPDGPAFAHVIGYYRESGNNSGLEDYYNTSLSPQFGEMKSERDVSGEITSEEVAKLSEPGNNLVLWLDADLQKKLYDTMSVQIKNAGVKRAAGVAIDPKTGGILALVSFPSFDNNLFSKGISQEDWNTLSNNKDMPFLNRVIAGKYVTGSIIKPIIASGALQEGIVSDKTTIDCKGQIVIDNPWFPDQPYTFKDWTVHGLTNIRDAIARSCNVFFYTIGGGYKNFKGLGPDKIKEYLNYFGWGEKLGIDLSGEVSGFVPDKEWKKNKYSSPNNIWMPGDTYNMSIGQGFLSITPLEVASSYAAIANGGTLFKPQVVKEIIDKDKNVIQEFLPTVIRQGFIDKNNLEIVKQGMRGTVTYGSATVLNDLPVEAAAKTGTAEIPREGYYHSWITVFAPYDDPQIVLTLMVEEGLGMHVAVAPTVKEVLEWYFNNNGSLVK